MSVALLLALPSDKTALQDTAHSPSHHPLSFSHACLDIKAKRKCHVVLVRTVPEIA
jgi:hypothetical protein